jgi:hypothetical protein
VEVVEGFALGGLRDLERGGGREEWRGLGEVGWGAVILEVLGPPGGRLV